MKYISKCILNIPPKHTLNTPAQLTCFQTAGWVTTCHGCNIRASEFKLQRKFYIQTSIQNNLSILIKSCTVLKKFTVFAVFYTYQ